MNVPVRTMAIPMLDLQEVLILSGIKLVLYDDNQATVKYITSGKFRAMARVKRVHGVQLVLLHNECKNRPTT